MTPRLRRRRSVWLPTAADLIQSTDRSHPAPCYGSMGQSGNPAKSLPRPYAFSHSHRSSFCRIGVDNIHTVRILSWFQRHRRDWRACLSVNPRRIRWQSIRSKISPRRP